MGWAYMGRRDEDWDYDEWMCLGWVGVWIVSGSGSGLGGECLVLG